MNSRQHESIVVERDRTSLNTLRRRILGMSKGRLSLTELPRDLLQETVNFLGDTDLVALGCVCRYTANQHLFVLYPGQVRVKRTEIVTVDTVLRRLDRYPRLRNVWIADPPVSYNVPGNIHFGTSSVQLLQERLTSRRGWTHLTLHLSCLRVDQNWTFLTHLSHLCHLDISVMDIFNDSFSIPWSEFGVLYALTYLRVAPARILLRDVVENLPHGIRHLHITLYEQHQQLNDTDALSSSYSSLLHKLSLRPLQSIMFHPTCRSRFVDTVVRALPHLLHLDLKVWFVHHLYPTDDVHHLLGVHSWTLPTLQSFTLALPSPHLLYIPPTWKSLHTLKIVIYSSERYKTLLRDVLKRLPPVTTLTVQTHMTPLSTLSDIDLLDWVCPGQISTLEYLSWSCGGTIKLTCQRLASLVQLHVLLFRAPCLEPGQLRLIQLPPSLIRLHLRGVRLDVEDVCTIRTQCTSLVTLDLLECTLSEEAVSALTLPYLPESLRDIRLQSVVNLQPSDDYLPPASIYRLALIPYLLRHVAVGNHTLARLRYLQVNLSRADTRRLLYEDITRLEDVGCHVQLCGGNERGV